MEHKICLETETPNGRTRMILTQAQTGGLQTPDETLRVDVDWILAEIGNYDLGQKVGMVCIDNVGLLLTDLDYFGKRAKLLATQRDLMARQIHGIFVQEETDARDLRLPTAEEFSTDVLIRLSFEEPATDFKMRVLEIQKARHQYYYRGSHHFSIAGRGIQRDVYLGARNERGPGIHVYPSIAAQLSLARDSAGFRVPSRGTEPIDLGHPDLNAAFHPGYRPTANSSTVLLAEAGTRYTYLALRFLTVARQENQPALMVSTKEDRDALRRICSESDQLSPLLNPDDANFDKDFRLLYLHPEFISAGKFAWDIMRVAQGGHGQPDGTPTSRLVFDNIYQLSNRFPLLVNQHFMVRAMLDLLRYEGVTPLFVDIIPPSSEPGQVSFDVAPYMTTFDNVLHLRLHETEDGKRQPVIQALKATGMESPQDPIPLSY